MPQTALPAEPLIRLGAFLGVFILMALWEVLAPRRSQRIGRWTRWPNNLGIVALDTALVRVLFPTAAVGVALLAERQGWGLLNLLALPQWLAVVLAVVVLIVRSSSSISRSVSSGTYSASRRSTSSQARW